MKRLTRGVLAATVALGVTVAGALPATANDKPVVTIDKNTSVDLDVKAGEGCSFAVQFHGEADIKTIAYKHKTVTIYSHAFGRATNPANHKSVKFNANVKFVDKELSNGNLASSSKGNAFLFGTQVGFGDDAGQAFLHVRGKATWTTVDPSNNGGAFVFRKIKGEVTNICTLID